jgi:hypothetical protein
MAQRIGVELDPAELAIVAGGWSWNNLFGYSNDCLRGAQNAFNVAFERNQYIDQGGQDFDSARAFQAGQGAWDNFLANDDSCR